MTDSMQRHNITAVRLAGRTLRWNTFIFTNVLLLLHEKHYVSYRMRYFSELFLNNFLMRTRFNQFMKQGHTEYYNYCNEWRNDEMVHYSLLNSKWTVIPFTEKQIFKITVSGAKSLEKIIYLNYFNFVFIRVK